jgi:O-antigen/teichoic acid export membrane protein
VRLTRDTLLNLIGLGLPLLVALVTIPLLIAQLGNARFGLLTLIWALVSYFGIFDLGLGRALTQALAPLLAKDDGAATRPVLLTALALMAALGLAAAVALALVAPWAVDWINGVPDRAEALRCLHAMALALPAVVLTNGLRGALEAAHAFGWVNAIRVPMGLYTFIAPLAVATWFGPRLDLIAVALMLGRWIALAAHGIGVKAVLPLRGVARVERALVAPLARAGGWMSVGNLASPLMGYADRFIIAALVSATAVSYYATAHELVTKVWIVPAALTAVLFPTFAATVGRRDARAWPLAMKSVRWLAVALLPLTLGLALFAHELLGAWVDPAFAVQSAPVLQLLALGIFINCLAHVPLALLQGQGQSRGPALLQAGQVIPYVALLALVTESFGLIGVACAWVARMVFDTAFMFHLAASHAGAAAPWRLSGRSAVAVLVVVIAFAGSAFDLSMSLRAIGWLAVCLVVATVLEPWRVVPSPRATGGLSK